MLISKRACKNEFKAHGLRMSKGTLPLLDKKVYSLVQDIIQNVQLKKSKTVKEEDILKARVSSEVLNVDQ